MGVVGILHVILLTGDTGLQEAISYEATLHNDIVQSDFVDSYKNLTLKSVSILKWVATDCLNSRFVIKMDTDVDVELEYLIRAFRRQFSKRKAFIIGEVKVNDKPKRDAASKWFVSKQEYALESYPKFVRGPTYGFTATVAPYLYQASLRIPLFHLEDVYVTGMCAQLVSVPVVEDSDFQFHHKSTGSATKTCKILFALSLSFAHFIYYLHFVHHLW